MGKKVMVNREQYIRAVAVHDSADDAGAAEYANAANEVIRAYLRQDGVSASLLEMSEEAWSEVVEPMLGSDDDLEAAFLSD